MWRSDSSEGRHGIAGPKQGSLSSTTVGMPRRIVRQGREVMRRLRPLRGRRRLPQKVRHGRRRRLRESLVRLRLRGPRSHAGRDSRASARRTRMFARIRRRLRGRRRVLRLRHRLREGPATGLSNVVETVRDGQRVCLRLGLEQVLRCGRHDAGTVVRRASVPERRPRGLRAAGRALRRVPTGGRRVSTTGARGGVPARR